MGNSLIFGDYNKTQKRTHIKRAPAMTLKELADSKGVSYSMLRRKFKKTGSNVDVAIKGKGMRIYYNAIQLMQWYENNT